MMMGLTPICLYSVNNLRRSHNAEKDAFQKKDSPTECKLLDNRNRVCPTAVISRSEMFCTSKVINP